MTTRQFYLRALAAPIAVPLLAAAGFALLWLAASHADPIAEFQWSGWLFGIAFIGAWSTIPYLLFVIGFVLWTRKPRSDRALRRVPWMAPVIIAVPFALWAAS
ncbi:MAG TPA: hypothetical protein VFW98_08500, partial [Gemmatimonadaceae bacterium]|nr:hypothetical protein [Gemmatimonadaceae bacterium]